MQWFRFHVESVHKRKVQALSGDLFKCWINLLCIAAESDKPGGALPPVAEIAWALRMDEEQVAQQMASLALAGLLDMHGDTYVPHEWDAYQYKTSTDRTRKWRQKQTEEEPTRGDVPLIVSPLVPPSVTRSVSADGGPSFAEYLENVTRDASPASPVAAPPVTTSVPTSIARDFEAFLRAYPANRRGTVNGAKQAWRDAHDAGELPALLVTLRALTAHKESSEWTKEGGQFVPNMEKYIRNRLWDAPPVNAPPPPKRVPSQVELNAPARGKLVI